MTDQVQLWLFFLVVLSIVVLPGVDMAYVLGSSLAGGRRRGLVAVAGVAAGGIVHVTAGALGITTLLRHLPGAYNTILFAGVVYIAWIGISLLRSDAAPESGDLSVSLSSVTTFRQGAIVNLLNPKAYLFMLAIFPQFLRPENGTVWVQAVVLGAIAVATMCGVYGSIALIAGTLRDWLQRSPHAAVTINRIIGIVLIAVALIAGIDGWTGT